MAQQNDDAIEDQRAKSGFHFVEDIAPGLRLSMDLNRILHTSQSEFQQVQVIDSYFGRTLVTDGKTQSAEHDEFVYHESLVHPSMFLAALLSGGTAKKVFIGGGGELATAREVLRHSTLERLVMVDLDPEVVDVCKKYLPEWGGEEVASHPKMELIIGDAHKYLMETDETFDVIIMDISDPIEAGPGIALYTQEFYRRASQLLKQPHGVFVTQAGGADYVPHRHSFPKGVSEEDDKDTSCFSPIRNTLATVFDHAIPYSCPMASFGEDWGMVLAFNGESSKARQLIDLPSETIDDFIENRITAVTASEKGKKQKGGEVLKHYDGIAHRRMFALGKQLRQAMANDERIMTKDKPIFMY